MSSKWPIRELAAFALCPHSRAEGIRQLDEIIRILAKRAQPFDTLFKAIRLVSLAAFILSSLALVLVTLSGSASHLLPRSAWLALGLSAAALAMSHVAWQSLQHGILYRRFGKVPDSLIPEAFQKLIKDFERAERSAWTKDHSIDARLFKSGWAILLFSDEPEWRGWVCSPRGARETREIFTEKTEVQNIAAPVAFNISVDRSQHLIALDQSRAIVTVDERQTHVTVINGEQGEESPLNNHSLEYQWLVSGTLRQFRTGLKKYLSTVLPNRREWEQIVLVVGRRELRKGDQDGAQAAAIREIIEALKAAHLSYPDTERGDSTSTIKQRLQGKRGKADIKGYFVGSNARNSAEKLRRTG